MIKLLQSVKEQSLPEKLFFFSLVVMVGASTLPWQRGHAGVDEFNAWQLGLREQLAMLVPVFALALRLAALTGLRIGGGIGAGGEPWAWLRIYRVAFLGLAAVLVFDLAKLPMKGFGFWLAFLAMFIQAYALHRLQSSLASSGRR
jgi:hypothetical protein